jgi:hypothetical protein
MIVVKTIIRQIFITFCPLFLKLDRGPRFEYRCSRVILGKYLVRVLAKLSAILTDVFHGFTHFLQEKLE